MKDEFRILGRRPGADESIRFEYRGVTFDQDSFHVLAGLNAVDTREFTEQTFRALKEGGQVCARMGAYKPRTSPYSFQGYGKQCLPYVFELAGKHGIRIVAMEVTRDEHVDEIREALAATGDPCGVMLQIGTSNTQNFELLKMVGKQQELPVLIKRGFGITLDESLNAAEYLATEGNRKVVFCLRGMKTNMGDPHRNFVDFAHVPVLKRLTRMPYFPASSNTYGRQLAPKPWNAYGDVRGLYAPMRVQVWPCACSACIISSTDSRESTAHRPANTLSVSWPKRTPLYSNDDGRSSPCLCRPSTR